MHLLNLDFCFSFQPGKRAAKFNVVRDMPGRENNGPLLQGATAQIKLCFSISMCEFHAGVEFWELESTRFKVTEVEKH